MRRVQCLNACCSNIGSTNFSSAILSASQQLQVLKTDGTAKPLEQHFVFKLAELTPACNHRQCRSTLRSVIGVQSTGLRWVPDGTTAATENGAA